MNSAHEVFQLRSSPKVFNDKMVTSDHIMTLLEAARWSASSFNEQPWRFIFAFKDDQEDQSIYRSLFDSLFEGNQSWAASAPVLMLVIAKTTYDRNGKSNRHAWYDTGLAMGNLSIQATMMDLRLHQMAGFSSEKASANLKLAEGYEPVAMVAIGFSDEEKPGRSRKSVGELILRPDTNN